jgi:hypothetical protein
MKTMPAEVLDENIANTLPFFEFKHEIRYFRYCFRSLITLATISPTFLKRKKLIMMTAPKTLS